MAKDYAADAVPRLAGQFYQSEKLTAMVAQMVEPLTVLEDHCDDMKEERWIDTAIGVQLDGCGYIVGVARRGMNDDEYRIAIKFKVFVNISEATPTDLIRGLAFLTTPTDAQYLEVWPATAILFSNGIFIPSELQPLMQNLSPAAISDVPVCVSYAEKPFRLYRNVGSNPFGELFVNGNYMTATGSDVVVNHNPANPIFTGKYSALGGIAPSDLFVDGFLLDVGGPTLAVHNRNTTVLIGTDHLTGVFQP